MIECLIKIKNLIIILSKYFIQGEFSLIFYTISTRLPNWLFRFNKSTFLSTNDFIFPKDKNPDVNVKIAENSDVDKINMISGVDKKKIQQMMNNGAKCFMASTPETSYATVTWITTGRCYIKGIGFSLDLKENKLYSFWLFTLPEARKKGLSSEILSASIKYAIDKGVNSFCVFVEFNNEYALKYHLKLGYKPVSHLTYIKFLFLNFIIQKNISTSKYSTKLFIREPKGDITII